MRRIPLLLAVLLSCTGAVHASEPSRPRSVRAHPLSIHEVVDTEAGAILWLHRDDRGVFTLGEVLPLRQPLRMWRYPEPMGDGTWIEIMDRWQRPMGTFRAALPPPGSSCGVEIPLVRGEWWLLIYDERGGMRRLLAHLEVGRQVAAMARHEQLPVLGKKKPARRPPVRTDTSRSVRPRPPAKAAPMPKTP